MRSVRAAVVVVLAGTGCQKMDSVPSSGANPRVSEVNRYHRALTTRMSTARVSRAEPPDERAAAFLKKVPLGTPVAEAQRNMEREGFTCFLIPEGRDKTDKVKPGTLYCYRRDDPQNLSVRIEIQEGKVTRLEVWPPAGLRGIDPVDRSRADLSKKIPPGTEVADARAVMEQEGFSCRLLTGRVEPTDAEECEYLDCERWENPGASSMDPSDWGTRQRRVIIVIRDGKVTGLLVRFKSDRLLERP